MDELQLTRPDDFHLHLRDGEMLARVVAHSARGFARAVVMPNLTPPVTTTAAAVAYRDRILAAMPKGCGFEPLMTLYLTDRTPTDEIRRAARSREVVAVKLYPAGATTNSAAGVTDMERVQEALAVMAEEGLPLLVHGEVTDPTVDIFDREAVFLERVLAPLVDRHPQLKVVLEHVTTADGAAFVVHARTGVAATITPHHLLLDRNDLFVGGLNPHHYCLPVLKRRRHREALLEAVASGSDRFFAGTDSAPHPRGRKESACGCAGVYCAHAAIELYAETFDALGCLDGMDAFLSRHGAAFYGLPRNRGTITLRRGKQTIAASFAVGDELLVPMRAGGEVGWRVRVDTEGA